MDCVHNWLLPFGFDWCWWELVHFVWFWHMLFGFDWCSLILTECLDFIDVGWILLTLGWVDVAWIRLISFKFDWVCLDLILFRFYWCCLDLTDVFGSGLIDFVLLSIDFFLDFIDLFGLDWFTLISFDFVLIWWICVYLVDLFWSWLMLIGFDRLCLDLSVGCWFD